MLKAYDAGEKIPVSILRKGKSMTIDLTAKEEEETNVFIHGFGDGGDFEWHADAEDAEEQYMLQHSLRGLEELGDMDFDIDVDVDELEDGVRKLRIMLNGKELELEELQHELQEETEELGKRFKIQVEESDDGEMEVRVKKI